MDLDAGANIVRSKLNRHNLPFEYDRNDKTLTIGKQTNLTKQWVLRVVIPLSASVIMAAMIWLELIPQFGRGKIYGYVIGATFVFGLIGIARIVIAQRSNKSVKTVSPEGVMIQNPGAAPVKIDRTHIQEFDYSTTVEDDVTFGDFFVRGPNGESHQVFRIEDKELRYIRDDLEYIKSYFNEFIK